MTEPGQMDKVVKRLEEAEVAVLRSLLGKTIVSVDGMEQGAIESAYLRLADAIIELASEDTGDDIEAVGFPWRISPRAWDTEHVFGYPLLTEIPDVGTVTSIEAFSDQGDVEVALAFRLADGRSLWTSCAGGDFVASTLGMEPGIWTGTKLSRTLSKVVRSETRS